MLNPSHEVAIVAIVVSYHPQADSLRTLVEQLLVQTAHVIVVDNGGHCDSQQLPTSAYITLLSRPCNEGVASALNIGIRYVQQHYPQALAVLTMDQDSLPAKDMVSQLWLHYKRSCQQGLRVGALGPQQIDSRSQRRWPFIAPVGLQRRWVYPPERGCVVVDHLITSGCLIPLAVLNDVGLMEERLFIDYVDIEWSLRCRARGYHLQAVGSAHLHHTLGDRLIRVLGREVALHSPLRHYYCMRNALLLWRHPHISLVWKLHDGLRTIKKFVFLSIFTRSRRTHLRFMLLGLWHGLQNHGGKL